MSTLTSLQSLRPAFRLGMSTLLMKPFTEFFEDCVFPLSRGGHMFSSSSFSFSLLLAMRTNRRVLSTVVVVLFVHKSASVFHTLLAFFKRGKTEDSSLFPSLGQKPVQSPSFFSWLSWGFSALIYTEAFPSSAFLPSGKWEPACRCNLKPGE